MIATSIVNVKMFLDMWPSIRPCATMINENSEIWANDKDVRLNSFNNTEITSESHRLWFQNLLSSNKKICFIFELNEEPFGIHDWHYS